MKGILFKFDYINLKLNIKQSNRNIPKIEHIVKVDMPTEEQKLEQKKSNRKFWRANNIIKKIGSWTVRMNQMISNNFIWVSKKERRPSIKNGNQSNKKIGTVEYSESKEHEPIKISSKENTNKLENKSRASWFKTKNADNVQNKNAIMLQRIDTYELFELIDEEVHAQKIVLFNNNESKMATSKRAMNSKQ